MLWVIAALLAAAGAAWWLRDGLLTPGPMTPAPLFPSAPLVPPSAAGPHAASATPGPARAEPHSAQDAADPLAAEAAPAAKYVEVRGFVLLPDGSPAMGETVDVLLAFLAQDDWVRESFTTDLEGSFAGELAFPTGLSLRSGRMLFQATVHSDRGFAQRRMEGISLAELLERPYEVELRMRLTGVLSGQVVSPAGEPIGRAVLSLYNAPSYDDPAAKLIGRNSFHTSPDGRFLQSVEPAGELVLLVRAQGIGAACVPLQISRLGQHVDVGMIAVSAEAELAGVVLAGHGAPLAGCGLSAVLQDSGGAPAILPRQPRVERLPLSECGRGLASSRTVTDERGRFRMEGLVEGTFTLQGTQYGLLDQPAGSFRTGEEHVVRFLGFPFDVRVEDEHGAPIAHADVTVTGLGRQGGYHRFTRQTQDEGLVFVSWPSPGRVLVQVATPWGELLQTPFDVPGGGMQSLPRCTVVLRPARSTCVLRVSLAADLAVPVPPALIQIKGSLSTRSIHRRLSPGGAPLEVTGLAAGTYEVAVRTDPFAGPHFILPSEAVSEVIRLTEGEIPHVQFEVRLGGRVQVRLVGDRRIWGADRWNLRRRDPDGTRVKVGVHRHAEDGSTVHGFPDLEHAWTLDPVLESGPLDLELLRNGEPFRSERLPIQPGIVTDWEIHLDP